MCYSYSNDIGLQNKMISNKTIVMMATLFMKPEGLRRLVSLIVKIFS